MTDQDRTGPTRVRDLNLPPIGTRWWRAWRRRRHTAHVDALVRTHIDPRVTALTDSNGDTR